MNWIESFNKQLPKLQTEFKEVLERLEQKKQRLDEMRPLPMYIVGKLREQLNLEWSYNSNAIEGNTLTLSETEMVVHHGMTIKGKSFKEHLEVSNHHDAIEFVNKLAAQENPISQTDIRSVHELVLLKIDKEFAGMYRNAAVRISGARFQPPEASLVPSLMSDFLDFISAQSGEMETALLAAIFHHRFVWIHPFFDGNGRTGRLLFNLLLLQKGYPPAIILKVDRKKYYDALANADAGKFSKITLLMIQAIERSLDIYLSSLLESESGYKSIDSIVREEQVPYGQEYISLLARQGKIDAYKENGVWFTSEKAVNTYITKRKRKRTV